VGARFSGEGGQLQATACRLEHGSAQALLDDEAIVAGQGGQAALAAQAFAEPGPVNLVDQARLQRCQFAQGGIGIEHGQPAAGQARRGQGTQVQLERCRGPGQGRFGFQAGTQRDCWQIHGVKKLKQYVTIC
jgi:hypothetical protein